MIRGAVGFHPTANGNEFEKAFACFLEDAPDVAAFAKKIPQKEYEKLQADEFADSLVFSE